MKKLFIIIVLCVLITSCNSNDASIMKSEVDVKLEYSIMQSGSLSRSSEDVYMEFYESCIKTKKLAPKNFELTFKTDAKDAEVKRIIGTWGDNEGVRLIEGSYKVSGNTSPKKSTFAGDSLWLTFDETINIQKEQSRILLSANYDCFLLMFDTTDIESIYAYRRNNDAESSRFYLNSSNGIYYLFVHKTSILFDNDSRLMIKIERPSGTLITLDIDKLSFEKGKYYYFNDVTNTFNIDPMESGN